MSVRVNKWYITDTDERKYNVDVSIHHCVSGVTNGPGKVFLKRIETRSPCGLFRYNRRCTVVNFETSHNKDM